MTQALKNWATNVTFSAAHVHYPETIAVAQTIVRESARVRVSGSRHSFNKIADTSGHLLSLERCPQAVVIDPVRRQATVPAGITYGRLNPLLHEAGFALPNLASLPHITVAGAVATATHGSGSGNGNLATAVTTLEFIRADGDLRQLSAAEDGEQFRGAVVGLGSLGVVTRLTLALQPTYQVRQTVYQDLPLATALAHLDEIMDSSYSVSLFTNWRAPCFTQVWLKERLSEASPAAPPADFFGALPAAEKCHPIAGEPADSCTTQHGLPGPWHERLPHFKRDDTPSAGAELQSEYFVPRSQAAAALTAVAGIREALAPPLLVSEIRTIAADDLWLSMCYGRDALAFHFTWRLDWPVVRQLLPQLEAQLAPFAVRPHWGKLFTLKPSTIQASCPRLADFQALRREFDPGGKFDNTFMATYCGGLQ